MPYINQHLKDIQVQISAIQDQLRQVKEGRGDASTSFAASSSRMEAFIDSILSKPLSPNFKALSLGTYDRSTDPKDHLESFQTLMILHRYFGALMCQAFEATFKGAVHQWFSTLPPHSIASWGGPLPRSFYKQLTVSKNHHLPDVYQPEARGEPSGALPETIGRLKNLEFLNLSANALVEKIHQNLTALRNLTVNYFSCGVPSVFEAVQVLDMSSNLINGSLPPDFGGVSLRYLNLSYNRLVGRIPPEFG
ncbi:PREDICTED: receptor-like protein 51 [Nelumbo nucifera]|uniref:Receptor-like protein 51 n=1 Tax=Nelumbo nucifera TaxID=4432 RepID=A0A1U8Q9X6_NELNU|nr:PREDICTED: receptor-like protein 51 [Nelumbo nucifera]